MASNAAVTIAETTLPNHPNGTHSEKSNGAATVASANEAITTKEGTFYVSKPYRSGYNKRLKAAIAFVPRRSHFDIENESSSTNEFRGFFTLFWISLFLFTVGSYIRSIETNGYPLNFEFASMFSRDARTLALSDAVLVLGTGLCVPFAKAVSKGWIKYYSIGVIIQHTFQGLVLFTAVRWTFNRQWPWVQSGFLTLHTLVLIMKMHSYMAVNGYLQWASAQSDELMSQLRRETDRVGGWEDAIAAAASHRASLDGGHTTSSSPGIGTPDMPDGSQKSYVDAPVADALRKRLVRENEKADERNASSSEPERSKPVGPAPHPLVDHPDPQISALATDYTEMEADLVSSGPEYVRWPENITYKNFAVYMLIPTLVYELEYPRTNRIRPLYVFEKTVATFGTFALLYTITETFILPQTPGPDQSFFRSLLDLALPFMVAYLLLFYIIFECICNGFAELSYFADRGFYEDWWNSTSWDEFSRKWNKPVHTFLLRHVYASTMTSYKLSRSRAMFLTFLLSAAVHELVMAVVTQKIRMYLFTMQLIQIPLIAVGRIPAIKRNKLMGNVVFWLGLYAGFPLLCVAYVAH
ncbi:MBOAT-domain-containing protein [Artomyces pyxidatus]|uniref:MBOAT-domain-containing protein n=1 Tax=Artomyces pyxidatus TaxID=48021 RepID=A0ACB8SYM4_9AGAM|nr:MBOAT-domain-containing protein [Artomyces pyxidatus]